MTHKYWWHGQKCVHVFQFNGAFWSNGYFAKCYYFGFYFSRYYDWFESCISLHQLYYLNIIRSIWSLSKTISITTTMTLNLIGQKRKKFQKQKLKILIFDGFFKRSVVNNLPRLVKRWSWKISKTIWKHHESSYPILKQLVIILLGISSSSKITYSKKRL